MSHIHARAKARRLARPALLALICVLLTIAAGPAARAAAPRQAATPPLLTGTITWTFVASFASDHSSDKRSEQAIVQVRLRWSEASQSYEDFGSSYSYSGSFATSQFNPDNIVGTTSEGTMAGAGKLDGQTGDIGAAVDVNAGPEPQLLLDIGGFAYHSDSTVTTYPTGGQQSQSSDDVYGSLLCDDPSSLIGRAQPGQPGVFSFACSQAMGGPTGSQQTTVQGFLSAPTARPRIADLRFEQQDVAGRAWAAFASPPGTVDGNQVRVIATVANDGGTPYDLPLRFMDGETHQALPGGETSVALAPGAQVEVTYLWDSQGWAWDDPTPPVSLPAAHPNRAIEVRLGSDAVLYDVYNAPVVVRPKPVLLVHGLNSNDKGWAAYPGFLRQANEYWAGFAVPGMRTGDDIAVQQASTTLLENARTLHNYVEQIRRQEQAWHVDIVAHSMGGLISRQYLHSFMPTDAPGGRPVAEHLVMLGTPNQGSECATIQLYLAQTYGLPNVIAPLELMPAAVAIFNRRVTSTKGTRPSVLAGNPLDTFVCRPSRGTPNDMVVTVPSAHYIYGDFGLTSRDHISMTGSRPDFVDWVLPHLAEGRAARLGAVESTAPAAAAEPPLQFAQAISQTVPAGGSVDVALSLPAADELAIALIAPAGVSAALLDSQGAALATLAAASGPASQMRGLSLASPAAGAYTLRLSSAAAQPAAVRGAALLRGGDLTLEAQALPPDDKGAITFTAALRRGGAAQPAASIRATLIGDDGATASLAFADDGRHGDGAAGDGIFGAVVERPGAALLAAVIEMDLGGETRATLVAGAGASPTEVFLPLLRR